VSCPYCRTRPFRPRHAHRSSGGVHPAVIAGVIAVAIAGLTHVPAVKAAAAGVKTDMARGAAPAQAAEGLTATPAGAKAVAFARQQLGRPYLWGGTGTGGFDCSGLAMEAWASAGVTIERTSEQQWASEHRVSTPRPGDLVFFAGSDGTSSSPGHVGIVTDPARHRMVDAYATGWGVVTQTYGLPSSPGGDTPVIGFTDPSQGTS
jgi:cell wall-associated NlpC family hydrolase